MILPALRRAVLAAVFVLAGAPAVAQLACVPAPYARDGTETSDAIADLLSDIAPLRGDFPALFDALEAQAPEICLLTGPEVVRGYFEVEANRIALHANLDPGGRAAVLLHEMRHIQQFRTGYCADNVYTMDETARAVFAFEADAMATTAAAAWALRDVGQPAAWRYLSEEWSRYTDIAAAYAEVRAAGDDEAAAFSAAFDAWFDSKWRLRTYRLSACFDYLEREDARHLQRGTALLPEGYFSHLCTLPDGSPYACTVPDDMTGP